MLLVRHIDLNEDGRELKTVMKREMQLSSTIMKRLKRGNGIYVNGQPVYTNYICRNGDTVSVDISAAEPVHNIVPEHGDFSILYEDDALIAVNKPAGILTHPSRAQFAGTLMGFVAGYLSESGASACHALNRLDRYTSGIVLFAKNAYVKALCISAVHDAEKVYLAIAFGRFINRCGVIDLPIKRVESQRMERSVSSDGVRAVTHYELLDVLQYEGMELSLLKFRLETGRTHQIRVHTASLGHPIIGDLLYGNTESKALSEKLGAHGQLLHAERLCFTHPLTGKLVDIHCPVTREDMCSVLKNI